MTYEELAKAELAQIRERVQNLIRHMQEVASMQKLRMMQEFQHTLVGFERDIITLAKKEDEK